VLADEHTIGVSTNGGRPYGFSSTPRTRSARRCRSASPSRRCARCSGPSPGLVLDGEAPPAIPEDGARAVRIAEACHRSAGSAAPVTVSGLDG